MRINLFFVARENSIEFYKEYKGDAINVAFLDNWIDDTDDNIVTETSEQIVFITESVMSPMSLLYKKANYTISYDVS